MDYLKNSVKYLLWATALTPIIAVKTLPFTQVFSKTLFLRAVIEVALILFFVYLLFSRDVLLIRRVKIFVKNPLVIALFAFFLSAAVSTIFASSAFYAFWGEVPRGDGLFNLLHFLAFLIISVLIFERKDWFFLFKLSLGVVFITIFYGWFQIWHVDSFPFALSTAPGIRGSTLGNPAFLGAYLLFGIGFALLVFRESRGFWRNFSGAVAALAVLSVFATNVLGGILGMIAGTFFWFFYFAFSKTRIEAGTDKIKKWSRRILIFLVALGLLFVVTRGATIWRSISGFNRLATISINDSSFQTRRIAMGVSWEAFKEKPIIGWGLENYITAYSQHYNPEYAIYEEAYFDRAHNKIADVAVMQGIFGLISYLGLFVALFYILFGGKKVIKPGLENSSIEGENLITTHEQPNYTKSILGALTVAYSIQNLFLFDTPVSYLMWFTVLGFVLTLTFKDKFKTSTNTNEELVNTDKKKQSNEGISINHLKSALIGGGIISAIGFIVYSLYAYHYTPYDQAKIRWVAGNSGNVKDVLTAAPKFLEPYNYIQPTLRVQLMEALNTSIALENSNFDPLTDVAIGALQEVIARNPNYDMRYYVLLGEVFNERGKRQPEFLEKGEVVLKKALELSPRRQDIYYVLAFNLAIQGRFEEAIETNKTAVSLDKNVARSHYNLGVSYVLAGRNYYDLAEVSLDQALDIGFLNPSSLIVDFNNISTTYQGILSAYILERDAESTIRIAEKVIVLSVETNPALAQDMELIIDYASRGDWDTLFEAIQTNNPNN